MLVTSLSGYQSHVLTLVHLDQDLLLGLGVDIEEMVGQRYESMPRRLSPVWVMGS